MAAASVGESQLQRIIRDLHDAVSELGREHRDSGEPVTDDSSSLHKFCYKLEYLLQFDQKEKTTLLGIRKDYWDYFIDCLAKIKGANDGIRFVKSIPELKTSLGKGRAFIRYSLVHQRLADTLQQCLMNQRVTSDWGHDLDSAWPTFARRSLGLAGSPAPSWRPPSRSSSISSLIGPFSPAPEFLSSPDCSLLGDLNETASCSAADDLRTELDQSELRKQELQAALDQSELRRQELQTELTRSALKQEELQTELNRSALKQEELQTELNRSALKQEELQTELNRSALKQEELQTELDQSVVRQRELEERIEHLQSGAAEVGTERTELEARLTRAERENQELLSRLDTTLGGGGRLEDPAGTVHGLLERLSEAERGREEGGAREEQLGEELRRAEGALQESKGRLAGREEEAGELRKQLEELCASMEEQAREHGRLRAALEGRVRELSDKLKAREGEMGEELEEREGLNGEVGPPVEERIQAKLHGGVELQREVELKEKGGAQRKVRLQMEAGLNGKVESQQMEAGLNGKVESQQKEAVLQKENAALKAELEATTSRILELEKVKAGLEQRAEPAASGKKEEAESRPSLMEAQLELTVREVSRLQEEVVDLRSRLRGAVEAEGKAGARLEVAEAQRDELRGLAQQLQAQLEQLNRGHVEELQRCRLEEEARREELEREAAQELAKIKERQGKLSLEAADSREGLHRANMEMAELGVAVCTLTSEREEAQRERDVAEARLRELEEEARRQAEVLGAELRRAEEKLPEAVRELQARLEAAEGRASEEISALRFQMSSETMSHQKQLQSLSEELVTVRAELGAEQERASLLEIKVCELESAERHQSQLLEEKSLHIAQREEELKSLRESLTRAEEELAGSRSVCVDLRQSLRQAAAEQQSSDLKTSAEIDDLYRTKKNLEERLIQLIKEKDVLWQKSDALEFEQKLRAEEVMEREVQHCSGCHSQFSWWLRRHQCGLCGRAFCYYCSNNAVTTRQGGRRERCCRDCYTQHSAVAERHPQAQTPDTPTSPPRRPPPATAAGADDGVFDIITEDEVNGIYERDLPGAELEAGQQGTLEL
ncbi:hypothetical protein AGOR_G00032980 [Albula goreensis]|uniref:FYVE-type domain-containing protein n=1 Tax=Albula goreensis TaxID=1534307 RepID=A0A8T3DV89_9TELE|nr:hypothetical protein AGOR_G00032980 [Albula goreensis]